MRATTAEDEPVHIDQPTLTAIIGLAAVIGGGVFFLLARYARTIAGIQLWAWGSLVVGASHLVEGPYLHVSWQLASVIFNIPFTIGVVLVVAGTMQFCGRARVARFIWTWSSLIVVVVATFTYAIPIARVRIPLVSTECGALMLWMALLLWRRSDPVSRAPLRLAAAASALAGVCFLIQALLVATAAMQVTFASPELPVANAILWLGMLVYTLLGNLMLLLLVALRLIGDLKIAAERDALTGLLNRRGMRLALETLLARPQNAPAGVMLLDIDHFKSINDTYGHDTGDQVLKIMGEVLSSAGPSRAVAGRWGGEEFCVVLPEATREEVVALAEAIRGGFAAATAGSPSKCGRRTVSVGIAVGRLLPRISDLISAADQQLYAAKQGGRDRVEVAVQESAAQPATASAAR